jgi:hypothetical protein
VAIEPVAWPVQKTIHPALRRASPRRAPLGGGPWRSRPDRPGEAPDGTKTPESEAEPMKKIEAIIKPVKLD